MAYRNCGPDLRRAFVGNFIIALCAAIYLIYWNEFLEPKVVLSAEQKSPVVDESYEAQEKRIAQEEEVKAKALNLYTLYQWESLVQDFHHILFHHKDFKQVTELLDAYRENTSNPLERFRYSEALRSLLYISDDHDTEAILNTLNEWAGLAPAIYYPLVARATLYMNQIDAIRDGRYAQQIPEADVAKIDKLGQRAWDDLVAANLLGPKDPEISAALMHAAAITGRGLEVMQKHYEGTLALFPHHLNVRLDMLHYLQPQWYGSHEEMRKLVKDSAEAREEFPYLFVVERAADSMIEGGMVWVSEETMRKGAAAFRKQAKLTPDDKTVLGKAAWFAYKAEDLSQASEFFELLGTTFPTYSGFNNVYQFHTARMESFQAAASEVAGTQREKALLDLALDVEPTNGPLSSRYLKYLVRTRDISQIQEFFMRVRAPYIMTGTLGEPPDLKYVEALALANGLFWDEGVQGADEERAVLDKAMALAPDNAFVYLLYGEHYGAKEDYSKARTYMERAREIDPAYLPALHSLAWLSYHEKRWDEGVALAKNLLANEDSFYVKANTEDANEIIALCEKKKAREAAK